MSKSKQASVQREHQAIERMLSAYLDGMLSSKEQAKVEHHLRLCPTCAHNLSTLRQTVNLLRAMPSVPVPRAFTIRAPVETRRARPAWGLRLLQGATAVAALMLVVVLVGDIWLGGLQLGRPQPALVSEQPLAVVQEVEVTRIVEKESVVTEEMEAEGGTVVAMAPPPLATPTPVAQPAAEVEKVQVEAAPTEAVSPPSASPAEVAAEATASPVVMPQTRTSEVAAAESVAPTESAAVGAGEEPVEGLAPTPVSEEARVALEAPTETASDAGEGMPVPSPLPGEEQEPIEPVEAQPTTAVAQVPEAGPEQVPAGEAEVLQEEPPIDWLTVLEIGLAVLVVFVGSATLLVSLVRRRSR
jgi:anti-sigma factor RsiW